MNIIYPPLVEQMYKFMHEIDKSLTKQDVYQLAVKENFLNEQGNPTKWALEQGFIAKASTPQEIASQGDPDLMEVFGRMPDDAFVYDKENGWLYKASNLIKAIKDALKDTNLTPNGRKRWTKALNLLTPRED